MTNVLVYLDLSFNLNIGNVRPIWCTLFALLPCIYNILVCSMCACGVCSNHFSYETKISASALICTRVCLCHSLFFPFFSYFAPFIPLYFLFFPQRLSQLWIFSRQLSRALLCMCMLLFQFRLEYFFSIWLRPVCSFVACDGSNNDSSEGMSRDE